MTLEVPGEGRVLLHCCCAPCSGAILECMLHNGIRPTIFFSNANIFPLQEYELRRGEIVRYASSMGLEVVDDDYVHQEWLESVRGLECEPERGGRCLECFRFRLLRAARYAAERGFGVLTTTLASSRWKDLAQVDEAGSFACSQVEGVVWWGQNWRRGGLQDRRSEIIREQSFYNQDFCGCEFSRREARRPLVMGILNMTPDSFFEASRSDARMASERIRRMLDEGADLIDIGAVSTRPGAAEVGVEEEWGRLRGTLENLPDELGRGVRISIDTTSSEIVRRALQVLGPHFIVNDISSGEDDPAMLPLVGRSGLRYVAMHKRGNPRTMDSLTAYPAGVCAEVRRYFAEFDARARSSGVRNWILDPGFGFAKTREQNLELLQGLQGLKMPGHPLLIGIADKRFTEGRTEEYHTLALHAGADILRVHDVAAARKTINDFMTI